MGFFDRLFNKAKPADNKQQPVKQTPAKPALTPEQFFDSAQVKAYINNYKSKTTLLKPQRSALPVSAKESKFGGIPNFARFNEYPYCDICHTPLNFVLQL